MGTKKQMSEKATKTPQIRFDGYTDAWEQRKFGELYEKVSRKNDMTYGTEQIISVANMYYKITSCESKKYPNDSLVIALCVNVADGFKGLVSEDLKQLGYNLSDYEVIWKIEG